MALNSRSKGKRGELELAKFLSDFGFEASRGQQFKGGTDSPDVICEALSPFHIECKRVEAGNLYTWLEQATRDSGAKIPIVMHRRNDKKWVAILELEHLLKVIKWSIMR